MLSGARDIKSEIKGVSALDAVTIGAEDSPPTSGVAVAGLTIDTEALGTRFNALAMRVAARATLGEDETLIVQAKLQTRADAGDDWADIGEAAPILVLTGGEGGTTERGVGTIGLDMAFAQRYLRVVATPALSASTSDTASLFGLAEFAGAERMPV